MTWDEANTWARQLSGFEYGGWRLPTTSELSILFKQLGGVSDHNIYDTHNNATFALFSNIQAVPDQAYWTNTPTGDAKTRSTFSFSDGHISVDNKGVGHFAIAIAIVPEPEAYIMLLAGLGLLGWRLRIA